MLIGEKLNASLFISILLIKLAFATVNIWRSMVFTCSAQGMPPQWIHFIYILLSLSLSLLRSKKLPSSLYSVSPGLCQQDCLYFPRIIWSLDESTSSTVTSRIYFEWKLKGTLNTASQRKSKIHAGARLPFTDMYFAALTVNITTYVFVFPTTDRVVVWHVEVKSARRCKYSSWAFMLSCQTSSQQQQTDLRAKGGLDVAPLRDCRIWLIISEWWSCHHNRSVSSLYTARATRWNVRTRQWHPLPQCLLVITVIMSYSSANYWKSIYFCKILGIVFHIWLSVSPSEGLRPFIYFMKTNQNDLSLVSEVSQTVRLSCALALSRIPVFGNCKFSQEAIRRLRCTSFISLTTSLSYTWSISTGAMIPLIKSQCDVNWQIRWWHLILGL